MKTRFWFAAVMGIASLTVVVFAQAFNARIGTWEFTMTMQGAMPMEGVPPAMRAQIEAEMRKPQVFKSCVTAEDLKSLKLGKPNDGDDDDCKVVTSKMTATSGDVVRECTGDMPRTETSHYEAPTPQTMKAHILSKSATGTMTLDVTGKWIAAACRD
jgi:hypothetical protein